MLDCDEKEVNNNKDKPNSKLGDKEEKPKSEKEPLVLADITNGVLNFDVIKTRGIGHCSIDAMFGNQVNARRCIYLKDALNKRKTLMK